MTIEQYKKINDKYKRTLVFHFGSGAGFFSEYNNMLRVIVYCLVHKIKFVMYSADAQFAMGKGWCDYFMPFCPETNDVIHHEYNKRFTDDRITTNFGFFVKCLILTILRFTKKYYRHYYKFYESFKIKRIKKRIGFNYFTYDLWYDVINMSDDSVVSIDGMGGVE